MELQVDKRIADLLPKHTADELAQLEKNCLEAGAILDPIKVWDGTNIIVDGINRYAIAQKHNLPYQIELLKFGSFLEVADWVRGWQLGRRNVDSITRLGIQSKILESDTTPNIAKLLDCSESAVRKAKEAGKTVESMPEDIRKRIEDGELEVGRTSLKSFSNLSDVKKNEVIDKLRADETLTLAAAIRSKGLSKEDYEFAEQMFSREALKKLRHGEVETTRTDLEKAAKLTPVKQEILSELISENEIATMAEALAMLSGTKPNATTRAAHGLRNIEESISKLAIMVDRIASDLKAAGSEGHLETKQCITSLQESLTWCKDGLTNKGL